MSGPWKHSHIQFDILPTMKKRWLVASLLALVLFFAAAVLTLKIGKTLPPGTQIPPEVTKILDKDKVEEAIVFSNFRYGWYFFSWIVSTIILIALLLMGFSARVRDRADRLAQKLTARPSSPLTLGAGTAFVAMIIVFITSTPDHPVTAGSLSIALIWGVLGAFAGTSPRYARTTIYLVLIITVIAVAQLPFDYYRGFVVEHFYGKSKESIGQWLADWLKSGLVNTLGTVLIVPLVYLAIRKRARDWWIWVAGAIPVFVIFIVVVGPVYIDPLFNKFRPLQDEQLRDRILSVASKAGIEGSRVFEVDKSRETETVNAYVTGLFGAKRIVMWDTLLEKFEEDEIVFVMAHEMGHYVLNHVWKFIGIATVFGFVIMFITQRAIRWVLTHFGGRMGFTELSDVASFPLMFLLLSVLIFVTAPMFNTYSRTVEHQADVFGLELTKDGDAAADAFIRLANENLSHPSPPKIVEWLLFTHPTLQDRIDLARSYGSK